MRNYALLLTRILLKYFLKTVHCFIKPNSGIHQSVCLFLFFKCVRIVSIRYYRFSIVCYHNGGPKILGPSILLNEWKPSYIKHGPQWDQLSRYMNVQLRRYSFSYNCWHKQKWNERIKCWFKQNIMFYLINIKCWSFSIVVLK